MKSFDVELTGHFKTLDTLADTHTHTHTPTPTHPHTHTHTQPEHHLSPRKGKLSSRHSWASLLLKVTSVKR